MTLLKHSPRPVVVDAPFSLFNIELTNKCPMRCVMCPRTTSMTRRQGLMAFGVFRKAIDELVETGRGAPVENPIWFHHFGESLLHPEWFNFIDYAVKNGIKACLSVNPIMLKGKFAGALLHSGLEQLYLSLDGHDEESFYKIRGLKNGYRASLANMLNFLELKQRSGSKTEVTVSMIDFKMNAESIEKTKSYWEGIPGVDRFLLKSFSTWDGSSEKINRYGHRRFQMSRQVECSIPWECMTILWDGTVVPCCNDYNGNYPLGKLSEDSLSTIWNAKPMQDLRQEFNSNRVTNPLCRRCEKLRMPREMLDW